MSADPTLLPAYVLSNEIMSGRLSPVDLMEAHLARIERLDPKLHAFIEVYGPQARLAAQEWLGCPALPAPRDAQC